MELHQVRYFLAACRTLNFTKAAEECNVAQPSLTRAIQKLEEELGGQLFYRERANTHLTELGRAMQPHLEKTYEATLAAKDLALSIRKGEVAHLRLGLAASLPAQRMARVLALVRDSVPRFELTLISASNERLFDEAIAGEFDLVISAGETELPERLRSWALYDEPVQVVMPREHALATRPSVAIEDLAGIDLIEIAGAWESRQARAFAQAANASLDFRYRASNCDHLVGFVRSGLALAIASPCLADGEDLVARPIGGFALERKIVMAAVIGRRYSAACDAFIKFARIANWAEARA
jgi:DNA-binding transcriptional LysR family regulator